MDFVKINTMYVLRPPTVYHGHDKVLKKCTKLRKEYSDQRPAESYLESIPQIREFYEQIDYELKHQGKFWSCTWERFGLTKYEELANAIQRLDIEFQFYRNLLIMKFSPQASVPIKQAMFFKALASELEVVTE